MEEPEFEDGEWAHGWELRSSDGAAGRIKWLENELKEVRDCYADSLKAFSKTSLAAVEFTLLADKRKKALLAIKKCGSKGEAFRIAVMGLASPWSSKK